MLMIKWQILWKIKKKKQNTKTKQANKQNPTTKYLLESLNAKHN